MRATWEAGKDRIGDSGLTTNLHEFSKIIICPLRRKGAKKEGIKAQEPKSRGG